MTSTSPTPPSRRRQRVVWSLAAIGVLLVGLAGWFFTGPKVWTDGRAGTDAITVLADAESPRQVLWTPPRDLGGVVNTAEQEYEPAMSPDGTEFYFVRGKAGQLPATQPATPAQPTTRSTTQPAAIEPIITGAADIYVSYRRNNAWTPPQPLAGVNSLYDDLGPRLSADGNYLVFYSNRPGGLGGYDLWASARLPATATDTTPRWSAPFNLSAGVNSEFDEYSPAPTPDGKHLFFSTNRTAAAKEQHQAWRATIREATSGDFDLWMADIESNAERGTLNAELTKKSSDSAFTVQRSPFSVSRSHEVPGVNTPSHEGASSLSPAGDFLYFASNRPGGFGKFDLYRSRITGYTFGKPENLGPSVNTADNETDPQLSQSGFRLYFSSDRPAKPDHAAASAGGNGSLGWSGTADPNSPVTRGPGLSDASTRPSASTSSVALSYDLYESDSREVFPQRQGRSIPVLSQTTWLMLGSLLLLVPLLLLLVRMDRRKLTILHRCLLVALLIHAALLFSFTFITTFVPGGSGFGKGVLQSLGLSEIAINLEGGPGAAGVAASDIAMEVRQQSGTDLPSATLPPAGVAARQATSDDLVMRPDVAVNVPQASTGREPLMVLVTPPDASAPKPSASLTPVAPAAPLPPIAPQLSSPMAPMDLKLEISQRIQQPEASIAAKPIDAPQATLTVPTPAEVARPPAQTSANLPIARPEVTLGSMAQPIGELKPAMPPIAVTPPPIPSIQPDRSVAPAAPAVSALSPSAGKMAELETVANPTASVPAATAQANRITTSLAPPQSTPAVDATLPVSGKAIAPGESSLAQSAADSKPRLPSDIRASVDAPKPAADLSPANLAVGSLAPAAKVIGGDASASAISPIAKTAERVASDLPAAAGPTTPDRPIPPVAGSETGGKAQSLAAAPGTAPRINPNVQASVAGVSPAGLVNDLVKAPEAVTLKSTQTPVTGGEPTASAAGKELAPGLTRQDVQTGSLAGGPDTAAVAARPTPGVSQSAVSSLAGGPATRPSVADAALANLPVAAPIARASSEATQSPAAGVKLSDLKPLGTPLSAPVAETTASPSAASPGASKVESAAATGVDSAKVEAVSAAPTVARAAAGGGSLASAAEASTRSPLNLVPAGASVAPAGLAAVTPGAITLSKPSSPASPLASNSPEASASAAAPDVAGQSLQPTAARGSAGAAADSPASVSAIPAAAGASGQKPSSLIAPAAAGQKTAIAPSIAISPATPSIASAGPSLAAIEGPRIGEPAKFRSDSAEPASLQQASPNPMLAPAASRSGTAGDKTSDRPVELASASLPGTSLPSPGRVMVNVPVIAPRVMEGSAANVPFTPSVSLTPPKISAPDSLFQRSAEQRRPLIEKLGGTKESENAVDRGLAYLARVQTADGFWTLETANPGKKKAKAARHEHDMALTGLSVLAFLASDHSPAKPGPYQQTVAKGVDWLVAEQGADGDLRGPTATRGGGSGKSNMYDHGIATMALAEAALMTGDKRYTEAAFKAAEFICRAQNKKTGGWRYIPGETGDTSVFGWQVLALHNCEMLGFQVPQDVRDKAIRFLSLVSSGPSRMLASYMPGEAPTLSMTAEALFCRILLGEPISDEAAVEVSEFLTRELPKAGKGGDLYFFYYASLSLSQMQINPKVRSAWDKWNTRCRDTLVATQAVEGDAAGSWTDARWGERAGAGTVFSTALATLTLEVYYRYLPMQPGDANAARAAWKAEEPVKPTPKPKEPKKPKFDAN